MSSADRLLPAYLRALTELLDPEIDMLLRLMAGREVHPMGVKILLASDVTSTVHGIAAAAASRAGFTARFSRKRFSAALDVPVIRQAEHGGSTVGDLFVRVTQTVPSMSQVRRVASGGGLRLVTETPGNEQETVVLAEADAGGTLASLLSAHSALVRQPGTRTFLKCGRSLIEIS
jgi:tyrosyl-tRNA synthetase